MCFFLMVDSIHTKGVGSKLISLTHFSQTKMQLLNYFVKDGSSSICLSRFNLSLERIFSFPVLGAVNLFMSSHWLSKRLFFDTIQQRQWYYRILRSLCFSHCYGREKRTFKCSRHLSSLVAISEKNCRQRIASNRKKARVSFASKNLLFSP